ncbi:integrin alpha-3-like isoform X2 [Girardinichthys multiradiatus]|uniref:integrin alpha-3-like isoform X2 n=1 Tax=Girardinichthys multiradiatus TaxID=208333 RepID=UPI001FACF514|nr:integrin alpha-3-like isoform X2 [Girardinichthys multiradiatus]XP_047214548.1 integrin alpha-3-like isoform X2 [Girardinichthys multiradiatus]
MTVEMFVLLSVCLSTCVAFNVDMSFPVLKTIGSKSLFGFSVALHEDLETGNFLLLVGAPKEKAEPHVPANRTGGVYSCPVTANQSDCSRMKLIDPTDLRPSEDLIEDMWLGVSVASQGRPGGRVLACGHRFVKVHNGDGRMIGQCYLHRNGRRYVEDQINWQQIQQHCDYREDHTGEGMCNIGISASITQTDAIFGSPGSNEWRGNVHAFWMNPDDEYVWKKNSFDNKDPRCRNTYLGYSVTQAHHLLSAENQTIVAGAPRDNTMDARGSVMLVVKRSDDLVIQQTLRGQQVGSYFGNAVVAVDLNGDGWNDLLVGAPFYFSRHPGAGGAVYVYMNGREKFHSEASVVLTGPLGSAFGMAVAAAGDLNQDGFQDFAVGAPFHDTGCVMIWTGSKEGVSVEPSQMIQGSTVFAGFRTFGYSLAAGVDVDGNNYPDLLVGSLDDTVALLRSRPVVQLNNRLRVSPDVVNPNDCDFCIQVELCFSFKFNAGKSINNISVNFTVTADVTSLKPRLRFHGTRESVYSSILSVRNGKCKTLRVGLLSTIQNVVEPLVFSLKVSLHENLPNRSNIVQDLKRFPVLSQTPQPIRTQIHIQKACGSDNVCQSNLHMMAQFTDENQEPFPKRNGSQLLNYTSSIRRLLLEVNVSNTASPGQPAEDAHNTVLNISIPPSLIYSGVQLKGDKSGSVECFVEGVALLCQLGNPFRSNQKVQLFIKFEPSELALDTREIRSQLRLSTLSEQSHLSPVSVSLLVEYSLQAALTLIKPGPIFFSGHVIGEQAMKMTEDIGSLVVFTFQVHVLGKPLGHLGNLEVEFDWPKEVTNGKWLLYLTEIRLDGTSNFHCTHNDIINPLNLLMSDEEKRMMRILRVEEEEGERNQKGKTLPVLSMQRQRKTFKLSCSSGARCIKFSCPLFNMTNSATLTVKSRLWNSTMTEDYSDASSVLVQGKATLKLKTTKSTINMKSSPLLIDVNIYPESGLQQNFGAPLWIIVVSVLAGVLLLAVICLLLWKCGFFKRASTREMYQAKTQRAHMKSQPSDRVKLTEGL